MDLAALDEEVVVADFSDRDGLVAVLLALGRRVHGSCMEVLGHTTPWLGVDRPLLDLEPGLFFGLILHNQVLVVSELILLRLLKICLIIDHLRKLDLDWLNDVMLVADDSPAFEFMVKLVETLLWIVAFLLDTLEAQALHATASEVLRRYLMLPASDHRVVARHRPAVYQ